MRITHLFSASVGLLITLAWPNVCAGQFPDAHDLPPEGWSGPVFKLRQDYPITSPPAESYPWRQFDFKAGSLDYLQSVLQYCLEGNTDAEVDWQVEKNQHRKWYHAPWMHSTDNGREFIHGLTRERDSPRGDLHDNQTDVVQNWAVSVYNPAGGYTIGQVWKNPTDPDPAAAQFADGTVSIKLLFTEATDQPGSKQVPFLTNAKTWQVDINRDALPDGSNVPSLRLLQIDVAVRDKRADSTTGWVFGTFIYNGNAAGATPYDRMVPVGLMWGNDPDVTPTKGVLQETFLNPAAQPLMKHYGWAGRLNGPVDNRVSSCLSCHSTAQSPQAGSGMIPPKDASDTARLKWFRNIKAGDPFDPDGKSLDYSLQLSMGIQRQQASKGLLVPATIAGKPMLFTKQGQRVFPVSRGDEQIAESTIGNFAQPGPSSPAAVPVAHGEEMVKELSFGWRDFLLGTLVGFVIAVGGTWTVKHLRPGPGGPRGSFK